MTLKDRLIANGLSVKGVAERVGTPPAHLYNLLSGVRRPKYELAKKIEAATGGLIQWKEFFERDSPPHISSTTDAA